MQFRSRWLYTVVLVSVYAAQVLAEPVVPIPGDVAGARRISSLNRLNGCTLMLPGEVAVNGQTYYTIRRYRNLPAYGGDPLRRDPNSGGFLKAGWHWVNNCSGFDYVEEDTRILVGHALLMKAPKCVVGYRLLGTVCVPEKATQKDEPRSTNRE